jgi:hypothetical protein
MTSLLFLNRYKNSYELLFLFTTGETQNSNVLIFALGEKMQ